MASYMQAAITVIVLAASLYIILRGGYGDGDREFASTTVAGLVGFWLRRHSQ